MEIVRLAHFEDEARTRESFADYLARRATGIEVAAVADDAEEAVRLLDGIKYGLLDVDIIVSDGNGFIQRVLTHMREIGLGKPVILASGLDARDFGEEVEEFVAADAGKYAGDILEAIYSVISSRR